MVQFEVNGNLLNILLNIIDTQATGLGANYNLTAWVYDNHVWLAALNKYELAQVDYYQNFYNQNQTYLTFYIDPKLINENYTYIFSFDGKDTLIVAHGDDSFTIPVRVGNQHNAVKFLKEMLHLFKYQDIPTNASYDKLYKFINQFNKPIKIIKVEKSLKTRHPAIHAICSYDDNDYIINYLFMK